MSSANPWLDARALLEAANLGVSIEWPNEIQVEPGEATWLKVDMTGDSLRPIEMGPNGKWLEEGALLIDIYAPAGHGTLQARMLAKRITSLFRGLGPRVVQWRRASLSTGDKVEDRGGNWWVMQIAISYEMQD